MTEAPAPPFAGLSDDELRWLYKLATGGHAALTQCLGTNDRLPVELREALFKLGEAVRERGIASP